MRLQASDGVRLWELDGELPSKLINLSEPFPSWLPTHSLRPPVSHAKANLTQFTSNWTQTSGRGFVHTFQWPPKSFILLIYRDFCLCLTAETHQTQTLRFPRPLLPSPPQWLSAWANPHGLVTAAFRLNRNTGTVRVESISAVSLYEQPSEWGQMSEAVVLNRVTDCYIFYRVQLHLR